MKSKFLVSMFIATLSSASFNQTSFAETVEAGSWGGNVRAAPNINSKKIGSLRNGDPVQLLENTGLMMNGYPWFRINVGSGITGYQWGGILCAYDVPIKGTFRICERDNRAKPVRAQKDTFSCAEEDSLRSMRGDEKTNIQFNVIGENDETQFKLYWLDYQGHRQFYKHVFAGDTHNQQTFMTHPWVVTAPVPGGGEDCIAIYMPKKAGRTVSLR